jgi:hypothetical protein
LGRRQVGDVYTDDAAVAVGQGAAGVARGDRRVGLDQVDQRLRCRTAPGELGRKFPAHATNDARRNRGLEARWATYRYGELADYGGVLVERRSRQTVAVHL